MSWRLTLRDDVQAMLGELDAEAGETLLDLMEVWGGLGRSGGGRRNGSSSSMGSRT